MCDYRTRKITFLSEFSVMIDYDGIFNETFNGTLIGISQEINKMMDKYGFKTADAIDNFTGEVLITVEETGEEE